MRNSRAITTLASSTTTITRNLRYCRSRTVSSHMSEPRPAAQAAHVDAAAAPALVAPVPRSPRPGRSRAAPTPRKSRSRYQSTVPSPTHAVAIADRPGDERPHQDGRSGRGTSTVPSRAAPAAPSTRDRMAEVVAGAGPDRRRQVDGDQSPHGAGGPHHVARQVVEHAPVDEQLAAERHGRQDARGSPHSPGPRWPRRRGRGPRPASG